MVQATPPIFASLCLTQSGRRSIPHADHHLAGRDAIGGDLNAGKTVHLHVDPQRSGDSHTTGGSPTLSLNDGGTATYDQRLRQQCADLQL